jgi:uncharacterized protein (TIGR03067 family)
MRAMLGMAAVLLAAGGLATAQDKKDAPKLDGTYLIVAMEVGGEKFPADLIDKAPEADRTVTIKGDKLIANKSGKEDSITIKLDSSKTPAQITTTEMKNGKAETSYGIYKVDGDTLTICMVEGGKEADRPKEFKTSKESKSILMTLKKKKDK